MNFAGRVGHNFEWVTLYLLEVLTVLFISIDLSLITILSQIIKKV